MAPTLAGDSIGNGNGTLTFEVEWRKPPGARLGIDVVLVSSPTGCGLVVENVNEGGVVDAWNRCSREPLRIRPGDFIVRVNGIENDISALAAELKSVKDVRILVQRGGADDAPQTWKDVQASILNQRGGAAGCGQEQPSGQMGQQALPPGVASARQTMGSGAPQQENMLQMVSDYYENPRRTQTQRSGGMEGAGCGNGDSNGDPVVHPCGSITSALTSDQGGGQYTFDIALQKPDGGRLGIDVLPNNITAHGGLLVKRISKGGIVDQWNESSRNNLFCVRPDDCIIRVNSIMADFPQMMEELRSRRELRVTVLRRTPNEQNQGGLQLMVPPPGFNGPPNTSAGRQTLSDAPQQQQARSNPKPMALANLAPNTGTRGSEMEGATAETALAARRMGMGQGPNQAPGGMVTTMPPPPPPICGNEDKILRFEVEVNKNSRRRLGLDVMVVTGGSSCGLVVQRVTTGGCVDQWNARNRMPYRVQPGDFIIQVNNIQHWQNFARMTDEFARDSTQVRFTVQRGPINIPSRVPGTVASGTATPSMPTATGPRPQGPPWQPSPGSMVGMSAAASMASVAPPSPPVPVGLNPFGTGTAPTDHQWPGQPRNMPMLVESSSATPAARQPSTALQPGPAKAKVQQVGTLGPLAESNANNREQSPSMGSAAGTAQARATSPTSSGAPSPSTFADCVNAAGPPGLAPPPGLALPCGAEECSPPASGTDPQQPDDCDSPTAGGKSPSPQTGLAAEQAPPWMAGGTGATGNGNRSAAPFLEPEEPEGPQSSAGDAKTMPTFLAPESRNLGNSSGRQGGPRFLEPEHTEGQATTGNTGGDDATVGAPSGSTQQGNDDDEPMSATGDCPNEATSILGQESGLPPEAAPAATAPAAPAVRAVQDTDQQTIPSDGDSRPDPAKLLRNTLQLSDPDVTRVLRGALEQRPWLYPHVAWELSSVYTK